MPLIIDMLFSKDVNCTAYLLLSYGYHQGNMAVHGDFASYVPFLLAHQLHYRPLKALCVLKLLQSVYPDVFYLAHLIQTKNKINDRDCLFLFQLYVFLSHTFLMPISIQVPDTVGVPVKDRGRSRASANERQHLHRQSSHRVSLYRKGWQRSGNTFDNHLKE